MRWFQEYRPLLSRIVLGILLAGSVYFLAELFGFGSSRHAREIVFSLGNQDVSRIVVTYLSPENDVLRVVDLGVEDKEVTDTVELKEREYQLEILLKFFDKDFQVVRKKIVLGEEDRLWIDLQKE